MGLIPIFWSIEANIGLYLTKSSAQSHLRNQRVGPGDIFLFWGLFQDVCEEGGRWFYQGQHQHGIFGWLQIDEVLSVGSSGAGVINRFPWLRDHPHARNGWHASNTIYVARKRLDFCANNAPGFGVFSRIYPLTVTGSSRLTNWSIPSWLDITTGGVGMTFHPSERWKGNGRLTAASRGQEFVADVGCRLDALTWAATLIQGHR